MSSPLYLTSLASNDGGSPRAEQRVNRPVFLGDERADFQLAFDDQAQRHSLHAPGGKSAADFVPQNRRNLVTHQAVEHAARLLRVHQILVHLGGMLEGRLDGLLRDFVEHHAINLWRASSVFLLRASFRPWRCLRISSPSPFRLLRRLNQPRLRIFPRLAQNFRQVRANRLSLAVRVARQVDGLRAMRGLLKIPDHLEFGGNHFVSRLEDVLRRHYDRLRRLFSRQLCPCPSLLRLASSSRFPRRAEGYRSSSSAGPSRGRRRPSRYSSGRDTC